jgi:hypothetical protein
VKLDEKALELKYYYLRKGRRTFKELRKKIQNYFPTHQKISHNWPGSHKWSWQHSKETFRSNGATKEKAWAA